MGNTLQLLGAGAITVGAVFISIPAGLIVGGVFLVLLGLAVRK